MAAKFDVVFFSFDWVEIDHLLACFEAVNYASTIKKTCKISDWTWDSEMPVELPQLKRYVDSGEIGIIEIEGGCGISLESANGRYQYSLWFDTERNPSLDHDAVTEANLQFYKDFFACLLRNPVCSKIQLLAMGCEVCLFDHGDYAEIMRKSRNVAVWLTKDTPVHASFAPAYAKLALPDSEHTLFYMRGDH